MDKNTTVLKQIRNFFRINGYSVRWTKSLTRLLLKVLLYAPILIGMRPLSKSGIFFIGQFNVVVMTIAIILFIVGLFFCVILPIEELFCSLSSQATDKKCKGGCQVSLALDQVLKMCISSNHIDFGVIRDGMVQHLGSGAIEITSGFYPDRWYYIGSEMYDTDEEFKKKLYELTPSERLNIASINDDYVADCVPLEKYLKEYLKENTRI
ncbi:MAG: hypothetical protein K6D56_03185 [Clostridia bacterium]|nr:hypothetical protein [Clostridia bacterium]